MPAGLIALEVVLFGLVLWLGLYLIGRDVKNLRLWLIGGGQVAYAVSISCGLLRTYSLASSSSLLAIIHLVWLLLSFLLLFPTGLQQFFASSEAFSSSASRKLKWCYFSTLIIFLPGTALSLLPLDVSVHASIL